MKYKSFCFSIIIGLSTVVFFNNSNLLDRQIKNSILTESISTTNLNYQYLNDDNTAKSQSPTVSFSQEWENITTTSAELTINVDDWGTDDDGNPFSETLINLEKTNLTYDLDGNVKQFNTTFSKSDTDDDVYLVEINNLASNTTYQGIVFNLGFTTGGFNPQEYQFNYLMMDYNLDSFTTDISHQNEQLPDITIANDQNWLVDQTSASINLIVNDWGKKVNGDPYSFSDFDQNNSIVTYRNDKDDVEFENWTLVQNKTDEGNDQLILKIDQLDSATSYQNIGLTFAFDGHNNVNNPETYDYAIVPLQSKKDNFTTKEIDSNQKDGISKFLLATLLYSSAISILIIIDIWLFFSSWWKRRKAKKASKKLINQNSNNFGNEPKDEIETTTKDNFDNNDKSIKTNDSVSKNKANDHLNNKKLDQLSENPEETKNIVWTIPLEINQENNKSLKKDQFIEEKINQVLQENKSFLTDANIFSRKMTLQEAEIILLSEINRLHAEGKTFENSKQYLQMDNFSNDSRLKLEKSGAFRSGTILAEKHNNQNSDNLEELFLKILKNKNI